MTLNPDHSYDAPVLLISMKLLLLLPLLSLLVLPATAEMERVPDNAPLQPIQLNTPTAKRGTSIMEALKNRQSKREFADRELSLQDLSDVLWAANGINRPDGKRTAPSAMNNQDIRVYICLPTGCYVYDPKKQALLPVSDQDARPDPSAPAVLILVADQNGTWPSIDTGVVSQNISLFCSGVGLATYPRGFMDKNKLKQALKLSNEQTPLLCHPIGYIE